jgi:hypothetical protein
VGAAHRSPGPHHGHEDDNDDHDHDDDHPDGDDDPDHVTHIADVDHAAGTVAVPDPRAAHADPVTCAGSDAGTGPGAHGDARGTDAVTGGLRVDGYTGVP